MQSPIRLHSARSPGRRRPLSPSKTAIASQRDVFLDQASHCDSRSSLYADLCRRFAGDPVVAEIVGPEPTWETPLRLLGGLHYLVLGEEAEWNDPLDDHRDFLARFIREQGVQTNEVQRSWVLVPLFLRVAERAGAEVFDLVELGPSAGLNLVWDRYRCLYSDGEWGPDGAPLTLMAEERRPVPGDLFGREITVRTRIGIDRAPIDVTSEEGARLLKCFVWAGQDERLERLDRAIAALRAEPPELVKGDFVELLPEVLSSQPTDALTVIFQTAALGYASDEGRASVRAALDAAGRDRPLVFVTTGHGRTGDQHWGLRIVYYPGAEREFAGEADYHGSWLDWHL